MEALEGNFDLRLVSFDLRLIDLRLTTYDLRLANLVFLSQNAIWVCKIKPFNLVISSCKAIKFIF